VIAGHVIKVDKNTYSFLPNGRSKIDLNNDLCLFLLNTVNYDDENYDAYSRMEKEKEHQQQSASRYPVKRLRKQIEQFFINLHDARKTKKTKSESWCTKNKENKI
jgi:hypothetical protein